MHEFKFFDIKKPSAEYDIEISDALSVGIMYGTTSWFLGFGRLEGGKTMGLSAYGKPSKLPNFLYKGSVNMNVFTQNRTFNLKHHPELKEDNFQNNANIAYNAQRALEEVFINKMEYIKKNIKCKNIVFSGGCALNILGNSLIKEKYPEYSFFVDPIANDATLSLGAAKFHYYSRTKDTRFEKINNIYFGPKYNIKERLNIN
jgi:carbamoyltransferase